jgi:hypothetical protein
MKVQTAHGHEPDEVGAGDASACIGPQKASDERPYELAV